MKKKEQLKKLDQIAREIIQDWYERVKPNYVTEEESRQLGVEPELKYFPAQGRHRIKFARKKELDVTYGLGALENDNRLCVESSVNNKSDGFDYNCFVEGLEAHYLRSRNEKPWTQTDFDRFTYGDLLLFEPRMGASVELEAHKGAADIIRLHFTINPRHEELLMSHPDILRDLIENYCIHPLNRIFAGAYREK
ncbi:MAG: hypothetical protein ACE5JX_00160 [Acidobacteriota bacterium]